MSTFWKDYVEPAQNVLITTDLEPDDLIALQLMAPKLRKKNIWFIVGEGNVQIKFARMKKYIKLMHFPRNSIVGQGHPSDKEFKTDGRDVFDSKKLEKLSELKQSSLGPDYSSIRNFLTHGSIEVSKETPEKKDPIKSVIISLKPMRELMEFQKQYPETAKEVTLIGYMGFNIRCLFHQSTDKEIISFLEGFKLVIYYETFLATGEKNSINKSSKFPFGNLPKYTKKLIQLWNDHIKQECQEALKDANLKEARRKANEKIITSIEEDPNQFVNADCGLITCLLIENLNTYVLRGTISFNEDHYSVPIENHDGNIIFIKPNDEFKETLWNRQMEFYLENIKEKIHQGRKNINQLITLFKDKFLTGTVEKGGAFREGETHVIFAFGSVVRFNTKDIAEIKNWSYNPKKDDYPVHRLEDNQKKIFKECKATYKEVLEDNPTHTDLIKFAYRKLITSGYPYPGGQGGDSIYLPLCCETHDGDFPPGKSEAGAANAVHLIGILFSYLGDGDIMTLGLTNDYEKIDREHMMGRECRRYDYMFPRPVCIIDHNLVLIKLI